MSDEENKLDPPDSLTVTIRQAFDAKVGESIAQFDATWSAAEARVLASKRRYRIITGVAASVALVAIVISVQLSRQTPRLLEFELAAGIMTSTQWSAPSDVLMPEHSIDIYQDVPELLHPTELTKGLLL